MLELSDLRIPDNSQLAIGAAACLGATAVVGTFLAMSGSSLPLPPSPPTRRIQGHFLPSLYPFLTVAKWIDEHGPVITIRSGMQKIVIVGRHKAAMDIMEKQGASTADRPRLVAIGEIINGSRSLAFAHAGDRVRNMRRALHAHLSPKVAEEYRPLQMWHAKKMILNILEDSSNFQDYIMTYGATTIMKVAYGKNTPTFATDPDVITTGEVISIIRKIMVTGPYMVEWIPWLKYIPWCYQEWRHISRRSARASLDRLNRVKRQMQSNIDEGPSFARHMLENAHLYDLTEAEMSSLAGSFLGGGADTVSVAICTVLMAAACFPQEQALVQADLDKIIGKSRAPTFDDQQSLPRLEAFISEALRWRPLGAVGLPHRTTKDVIWENYCIPAGTTIYGNHWAITRDPEIFPQPHEFKPQRWINDQGSMRVDTKHFVFGFGRRICPGLHVANNSVFITSLLIIWAFQLELDPSKPFDDMAPLMGNFRQCPILFKPRVPEAELRHIMDNTSEVF